MLAALALAAKCRPDRRSLRLIGRSRRRGARAGVGSAADCRSESRLRRWLDRRRETGGGCVAREDEDPAVKDGEEPLVQGCDCEGRGAVAGEQVANLESQVSDAERRVQRVDVSARNALRILARLDGPNIGRSMTCENLSKKLFISVGGCASTEGTAASAVGGAEVGGAIVGGVGEPWIATV